MTWEGTDAQPGEGAAELTSFSGGPAAESCRAVPKAARDAAYAALLEGLYPGFRKSYLKSRFMDWPAEPFTGAGYSFPAPGQIMTMGPILRAGIGHLHFAGEHACYKFVGYMEGAQLRRGAGAADRRARRHYKGPCRSAGYKHPTGRIRRKEIKCSRFDRRLLRKCFRGRIGRQLPKKASYDLHFAPQSPFVVAHAAAGTIPASRRANLPLPRRSACHGSATILRPVDRGQRHQNHRRCADSCRAMQDARRFG